MEKDGDKQIVVSIPIWKELMKIRVEGNYKNMNEVIEKLLVEDSELRKIKQKI